MLCIQCKDNSSLRFMTSELFDLIYMDPPFNTGKIQKGRAGSYDDSLTDYLGFLRRSIVEAHRLLKPTGSLFVHIDQRSNYLVRMILDQTFGSTNFQNELIWAYDFGGRSKRRWPAKHDTIFWYSKHPKKYTFNYDEIDRVPYMAPGLCGPEKAARGKCPTDVFWQTIAPTNGPERTGYPTQKPLKLLERIVKVHSNPGDVLLDPFAGSGTFGEAAALHDRHCLLIDNNPEADLVTHQRLDKYEIVSFETLAIEVLRWKSGGESTRKAGSF